LLQIDEKGPAVKPFLLIPQGQFEFAQLFMITAVTVFVSFLLFVLWTLDDMEIRTSLKRQVYWNMSNHCLVGTPSSVKP